MKKTFELPQVETFEFSPLEAIMVSGETGSFAKDGFTGGDTYDVADPAAGAGTGWN